MDQPIGGGSPCHRQELVLLPKRETQNPGNLSFVDPSSHHLFRQHQSLEIVRYQSKQHQGLSPILQYLSQRFQGTATILGENEIDQVEIRKFARIRNKAFNCLAGNYSFRQIIGNGSSVSSNSNTTTSLYTAIIPAATSTASTFGNYEVYIPNYAGSTQKSTSTDGVSENNGTTAYAKLGAGLWTGTAAINAISVLTDGTLFAQYSTATLYGISKS